MATVQNFSLYQNSDNLAVPLVVTDDSGNPVNLGTAAVTATQVMTISGVGSLADSTVTLGDVTYTFKSALTGAADEVLFTDATDAALNLIAALDAGAGEGTVYGTGTVANPKVVGVSGGVGIVDLYAIDPGVVGNSIVSTATDGGDVTFTHGAAFVGGVDGTELTWVLATSGKEPPQLTKTEQGDVKITGASGGNITVTFHQDDTADIDGKWYHQLAVRTAGGVFQTYITGTVTILDSQIVPR